MCKAFKSSIDCSPTKASNSSACCAFGFKALEPFEPMEPFKGVEAFTGLWPFVPPWDGVSCVEVVIIDC